MTYIRVAEATAASDVNTDMLQGDLDAVRPYPRKLSGFALTGSAAAGDSAVAVFIGDTRVAANIPNARAGGVVQIRTDVLGINKIVPPNTALRVLIVTPGNTNVLFAHLFLSP